MTLGQRVDALIGFIPPNAVATCLLAAVPLVLASLYSLYWHVPRVEKPVTFKWQAPIEADSSWTGRKLSSPSIDSHLTDNAQDTGSSDEDLLSAMPLLLPSANGTREYITAYAPSSFYHLGKIPSLSGQEISDAIGRAERAQHGWAQSSWHRRRRVLRSLLVWCEREAEQIARVASRDTGKTLVDAAFGEILTTCEKLRWTIANAEQVLKPDRSRGTNLLLAHKKSHVRYEPLGVVAAIVSWNYPAHNALSPLISSLAAGNAIVIKPSELVAWSTLHYMRAVKSCLAACGENPDLVQCIVTRPRDVEALTGDPRIRHITFIGSEQVGALVAKKAAEVGTPVLLELGGKDPCVVLESADCETFKHTWMRGVFQSMSQNCIGIERFIVHSSHQAFFRTTMASLVKSIQLGDVLSATAKAEGRRVDAGAMVSDRLFDELESLIGKAVKDGATLVCGGKRIERLEDGVEAGGHWFAPTLLMDVKPTMRIAQQETFAPVMLVMSFNTLDEAVTIANGTRYGLGASVFGRSKRDCDFVVDRLDAGMICTNDFGSFYLNQGLPFGGTKSSGHGRFAGPEGLRGLCNLKVVMEDRWHGVVQTTIPPPLRYPIERGDERGDNAWTFVRGLIALAYAQTLGERLKGVIDLVKTSM